MKKVEVLQDERKLQSKDIVNLPALPGLRIS